MLGAPDWRPRSIVTLLAIRLIPALIFSWVFEMTPEGRDLGLAVHRARGAAT
jgi:hypothetical protein